VTVYRQQKQSSNDKKLSKGTNQIEKFQVKLIKVKSDSLPSTKVDFE
jgi:hypothetical protein